MIYRLGRLIDHLDIRVGDAPASHRFYRAIWTALGHGAEIEVLDGAINLDEVYITAANPGGPVTTGLHLCFQARDRAAVDAFHAQGLAAGGRDNGAPGLRPYHPGYYAAFLLDPDGNNIEAKLDERVTARSAPAVTITTG
ncbi:VOC family protein [Pseudooceanicola sp. C21-150M6]|uniref:VOC family protein n=1 Tax=Pseudooceanicola sp. C21-150M6 TaxID=3434355 RepID=UPI003D7F6128